MSAVASEKAVAFAKFRRPTALGELFDVTSFKYGEAVLFAVSRGDVRTPGVLVRIHSPCLFGESFGVNSCDCGEQLQMALKQGSGAKAFLLIYLSNQEGRGHGIETKVNAVALEANQGFDMTQAFQHLGLELDLREYAGAADILKQMVGDLPIRLMTNNPKKISALQAHGVQIERVPLEVESPNAECRRYLNTKRRDMGHLLSHAE